MILGKNGKIALLLTALCFTLSNTFAQQTVVWQIGKADHSSLGMALAPNAYEHFLDQDFGWEDRFFLVGFSRAEKDWPYVLPGPGDSWGGTGGTSGIHSQVLNILFGVKTLPVNGVIISP